MKDYRFYDPCSAIGSSTVNATTMAAYRAMDAGDQGLVEALDTERRRMLSFQEPTASLAGLLQRAAALVPRTQAACLQAKA